LLTCQRFELIGTFLHVVSKVEEEEMNGNRLRKLLPLIMHIKNKCLEYYQPLQQLSVDERMVKSKARSHLIQYMRNKPTKWGFKLWVIADPSGYTLDFNVYTGKESEDKREHGLAYDVVIKLIGPFCFQGYHLYIDNFYTSAKLLDDLYQFGIYATGTFRADRVVIPSDVKIIKAFLSGRGVVRGMGYYWRPAISDESQIQLQGSQTLQPAERYRSYYLRRDDDEVLIESASKPSPTVYTVWKDARAVCVMSSAFPGHAEGTVSRKKVDSKTGTIEQTDIDVPIVVQMYNKYMGGVDKSDQYLAYHNVLRKTVRYWKTLFYHLVDVAAVNAYLLYNYTASMSGIRTITENDFRDHLVLQIIDSYGKLQRSEPSLGRPPRAPERMKHGSCIYPLKERSRCQYCRIKGVQNWTQQKCLDCEFHPALCQVQERDCHLEWHKPAFDEQRSCWFRSNKTEVQIQQRAPNTRSKESHNEEGETSVQELHGPSVGRNQVELPAGRSEEQDERDVQSQKSQNEEQDDGSVPEQHGPSVGRNQVELQDKPAGRSEESDEPDVRSKESQEGNSEPSIQDLEQHGIESVPGRGRPKGSINRRRRSLGLLQT